MNRFAKLRAALAPLLVVCGIFAATVVPTSAQTLAQPAAPAQNTLQPTSITLKSNATFESLGSTLTLSGIVSPNAQGEVVVYNGDTEIGRAFILSRGAYQLTIPGFSANSLGVGVHTLTAVYLGNSNFAASGSAPLTEMIYPHW
jgi:hypothetical protein